MSEIEIDAGTFAGVIREQKGLPITDGEADGIAWALETCHDEAELLGITVSAVRLLADRLERSQRDGSMSLG